MQKMDKFCLKNSSKQLMKWYARLITDYPWISISFVVIVTLTVSMFALFTEDLPNFAEPQLGFESRGTDLANKLVSWKNLKKESSWHGHLAIDPNVKEEQGTEISNSITSREFHEDMNERTDNVNTHYDAGFNRSGSVVFCGSPVKDYSHFVFSSVDSKRSLFNEESIISMCEIDRKSLRSPVQFRSLCERQKNTRCCPSWSIGNYIAAIVNKSSCFDIKQQDVSSVEKLLKLCNKYYRDGLLAKCVHDSKRGSCRRKLPSTCFVHRRAIFDILHYLSDVDFLKHGDSRLTYSMLFLPVARSTQILEYYKELQTSLRDDTTQIVAMDLGIKDVLFDEYLIGDLFYVGIGGLTVMTMILMYTKSIVVTFVTAFCIVISMSTTYFIYTKIYDLKFFPFINLLTFIICLGIGVDDLFIYMKQWSLCSSRSDDGSLGTATNINISVLQTCQRAIIPMFITTLTTLLAFVASYSSHITAIKCFSIFGGTAVFVMFLLMMILLPAAVVITARCSTLGKELSSLNRNCACNFYTKLRSNLAKATEIMATCYLNVLNDSIVKLRYFWIFTFVGVLIYAVVVVLYRPGLSLPDSAQDRLFVSNHPFELYENKFVDNFWFEKKFNENSLNRKLPLNLVWGILPVDDGDHMNPYDAGKLKFDDTFNVSSKESQQFLLDLCLDLRKESFFFPTIGPQMSNCFIETFVSWMSRRCNDSILEEDYHPCCEASTFPFKPHVFEHCLRKAISDFVQTPGYLYMKDSAGPLFSKDGRIRVVTIEYETIYDDTFSHSETEEFVTVVETWLSKRLESAPPGMKNGWFVSHWNFYDLQLSILKGIRSSVSIASVISFVILIVATFDVIVSVVCVVVIFSVTVTVIASLTLIGWKLNIIEAVTVSVAIGLSIDYTMHYAVTYVSTRNRIGRINSPSPYRSAIMIPVTMSAITTFVCGSVMFASSILVYNQIGTFLVVLSSVSFIFSTLFFHSAMSIISSFSCYSNKARTFNNDNRDDYQMTNVPTT